MIAIKRKVSLDFLGDEYKDSFITFKSMPVKKFQEFDKQIKELAEGDLSSITLILGVLEDCFIDGKFLGEDVEADEIQNFDVDALLTVFKLFTGQELDPKEKAPSSTQSQTTDSTSK